MSRTRIIAAVVVVALAGGGAYLLTKDDNGDKSSESTSQTANNQTGSEGNFSPVSTEGLEFKATLTTTKDGTNTVATIEQDDQKNIRYTATQGGQQVEIIYTKDAYYMCTAGNCIKYPISQQGSAGFDPGTYTYDASKLEGYKNNSAYKGQKSCPAGTCDVWSVTAGGYTSTIYVDTKTKRISQVESTVNGATTKIVYEYTDVTITVPTNAQTLPNAQ